MQHLHKVVIGLALAVGLGFQGVAGAVEKSAATPATGPDAAMMEKMQKYMTPGPTHRVLDPLVGRWTTKSSFWMKPGNKPEVSTGTAQNVWALNSHFLKGDYQGTWGGQPFEGVGYWGYDNFREEYQSVWVDSMGTGIMYAAGKYDPATKTLHTSGTVGCPMTGDKNMAYRTELKISGPDKHSYSSYSKGPDGKEYKNMEMLYTRIK